MFHLNVLTIFILSVIPEVSMFPFKQFAGRYFSVRRMDSFAHFATKRRSKSTEATNILLDTENHMGYVSSKINKNGKSIIDQLAYRGYSIIDNFLGLELCNKYRDEAVKLYKDGVMIPSQSTRWVEDSKSIITYDKHNVLSTQLLGGESYYTSPRLHEYIVSMVQTIVPVISSPFPEARLSGNLASNKLAVCLGNGSYYDKHFDNSGSDDMRKLTVLYYLNPNWDVSQGGFFRAFREADRNNKFSAKNNIVTDEYEDIAPIGDRLLVFWSDRLEHSVQPSFAQRGDVDHRYAMTVWIATTDATSIHI